MQMPRPTASTITDPVLEVLLDGIDLLERIHRAHEPEGICIQCMSISPCNTTELIQNIRMQMMEENSRQRSESQENPCTSPTEPPRP